MSSPPTMSGRDSVVAQATQCCNAERDGDGANLELLPTRKEGGATVMAYPAPCVFASVAGSGALAVLCVPNADDGAFPTSTTRDLPFRAWWRATPFLSVLRYCSSGGEKRECV
jgi:hypothetical protein